MNSKQINLIKNALAQAEMRQGCTDYTPYAEILAKELDKTHPAPTPDLLLTDADKLEVAKIIANGAGFGWAIADRAFYRVLADKIIDFLLSKLQQARPTTEQTREKIADVVFKVHRDTGNDKYEGKYYYADQILRLLPDEQGIRQSERKAIGEWIEKNAVVSVESKEVIPGKLSTSQATYGFYTKEWHELLTSLRAGEPPQGGEK